MEEIKLREHLEFLQVRLHFDITNEAAKANLKQLRDHLQNLANMREDGRRIRSKTQWMQFGDTMNIFFFSLVREWPVGGLITELYDENKIVVSLSADLA